MQLLAMLQMIVPIDSGECFCLFYYCIVLMYRGHKLEQAFLLLMDIDNPIMALLVQCFGFQI